METTTLHHVPVAELAAHPGNLREQVDDLDGLAKSILQDGVIEPLVVVPQDGGYMVVAGHRRLAAAVLAGLETVPCSVRPDLSGAPEQVVTMLAENLHRKDLTPTEAARGFEQLGLLGMSDTSIAKATGMPRAHVKQARAVAADPVATAALDRQPAMSLAQALTIAEVADGDQEAADELAEVVVTAPGRFDHMVAAMRQDREDEARRAQRIEELTAQGITVVEPEDVRTTAEHVSNLTSADTPAGEFHPLDPDEHESCPGHAVSLSPWDPDHIRVWCLDPAAHGHRSRWGDRPAPEPVDEEAEADRKREERRTVIANNKASRAATEVRRAYIGRLLTSKKVPKGTLRYVVTAAVTNPEAWGRTGSDALIAELLDTKAPIGWGRQVLPARVEQAPDARLALVLLAQHAADIEGEMPVDAWRHSNARAAAWLTWLASTGYELSDVEKLIVDAGTPKQARPDADTDAAPDDPGEAVDAVPDSTGELADVVPLDPSAAETELATNGGPGPAA